MPHKNDLDLGRDLVFRLVDAQARRLAHAVHTVFRHRGAYQEFKPILDRQGLLQRWYDFEASAIHWALQGWTQENGLAIAGPSPATPKG